MSAFIVAVLLVVHNDWSWWWTALALSAFVADMQILTENRKFSSEQLDVLLRDNERLKGEIRQLADEMRTRIEDMNSRIP